MIYERMCEFRKIGFKLSCSSGGNVGGVFGLALVQGEWKVYVSGPLDRERQDRYLLNVTASDGLYVARAALEVTVMDANDNSPVCNQVSQPKGHDRRHGLNMGYLNISWAACKKTKQNSNSIIHVILYSIEFLSIL